MTLSSDQVERKPDSIDRVKVGDWQVVVYSFGRVGDPVLFCLSGGPGLPCDYVRDSHCVMADRGYRVVIYDQLGTGASDHPNDSNLWNIQRCVEELEIVRQAMKLGRVHLLGQSWGAWLGFEYCLTYPSTFLTFTSSSGTAEIPLHVQDLDRLRAALGPETVFMMDDHEAAGTTDHPEYQAAITILNYRHLCRLREWPAALSRSMSGINMQMYGTMWGPNEFTCTGNLRNWDRLADIGRISQPCLVLCGHYDELTTRSAARICRALPNGKLKVFRNSSHTPFLEESSEYFDTLTSFLHLHKA
jgi:proline iminopeptidase